MNAWPAVFLDMNPNREHVGRIIMPIAELNWPANYSAAELTTALHEEWVEIPAELLRTLAEGMPKRLTALVASSRRSYSMLMIK